MAVGERTHLLSTAPESSEPTPTSHHLLLPRSIVYQLTSLLCTVDGLAGTGALAVLKSKQIMANAYGATIDYEFAFVAGALLTAAGSLAGAACGIMFLVLMLHPGHYETPRRVIVKEVVFAFFSCFFLVASIISTVVLATGSATLYTPDLTHKERLQLIKKLGGSLAYKDSLPALLFVILGWVCWLFLTLSLILVSLAGRHVLRSGPELDAPKGLVERLADRHLQWLFDTPLFAKSPSAASPN